MKGVPAETIRNRFCPLLLAMAAPFLLTRCETASPIATVGSTSTPDHHLPKYEYPFDSSGKYREDWVRMPRGVEEESGRGSSSASRTGSSNSTKSRSSDSESSSRAPQTVASIGRLTKIRFHTVDRSDTLWGISRRYGVSVSAIKSANNLGSDLIRTGQTLRIP